MTTKFETGRFLRAAVLVAVAVLAGAASTASGGEHRYTATNPTWRDECASCHLAYPAQLLPASSWTRIMNTLDRHFGSDASLATGAGDEIALFLQANAARGKRAARSEGQLRITKTAWFTREHDEVPSRTWRHADVRTPANCSACHRQAEQGDFSERGVRLPR